jgi:hypothetical protein
MLDCVYINFMDYLDNYFTYYYYINPIIISFLQMIMLIRDWKKLQVYIDIY